ncbi:AAA family ATPase [Cytobacillus sp. NCCP-133]|uniref:AAA family ATPase n=1 Tax=Cytobacillus sp. NCCP-133 TaxID=766848 RepID=UPI00222F22CB|nr:ATP-binding protein [Cytobacillus sp. NCCP-133]GLB59181.1 ATPase [Cytobacillus sp. NCCP-133]
MARGDLLKKLLLAYQRGEDKKFKEISLEIIRDERKKNHNVLADQLQKIIEAEMNISRTFRKFSDMVSLPKDDNEIPLIDIRKPQKYLDDIILSQQNEEMINEIIEEFWRSELLKSYNLKPKTKILFCGPPGCGKSLCAEALAGELGLNLIYNRFDSIISSYLGDTSTNLRKVFDFVAKDTWVMLFDEFDAIGKSRNDSNEHGELKRVVNSFLQIIDNYDGNSLIIACTNHEDVLDKAIWRRFDEVIYFGKPNKEDISKLIRKKTASFSLGNLDTKKIVDEMDGFSHAEIERACHDAIKYCLLHDIQSLNTSVIMDSIKRQKQRIRIYKGGE